MALREGRPALVRERLMNPLGLADALGFRPMGAWIRSMLAEAAALDGRLDEAAELVAQVEPFIEVVGLAEVDMTSGCAFAHHFLGDSEQARALALRAARDAAGLGAWTLVLDALHVASIAGAAVEAAELVDGYELQPEGTVGEAKVLDIRARAAGEPQAMVEAGEALAATGMVWHGAKALVTAADVLEATDPASAESARLRAGELATVDGVELTL